MDEGIRIISPQTTPLALSSVQAEVSYPGAVAVGGIWWRARIS